MRKQTGPGGKDNRSPGGSEVHRTAWEETLADMEAMAEELRDRGWTVVTIQSGDTAPENPEIGGDRFGLSYVIPGNKAKAFSDAFTSLSEPQYRVYRRDVNGRIFILTRIADSASGTAILIAGTLEERFLPGLVRAAVRHDEMYTHVQKLDGTHLGTFRHEDYELFFPNAEEYLSE